MFGKIFRTGQNKIIRKKRHITVVLGLLVISMMITISLVNVIAPYLTWKKKIFENLNDKNYNTRAFKDNTITEAVGIFATSEKVEFDEREMYLDAKKCLNHSARYLANYFAEMTFGSRTYNKNTSLIRKTLAPNCKESVLLMILVTSSPHNFLRRAAVRLSWARSETLVNKQIMKNQKKLTWKTIFALGNNRNREIEQLVEKENDEFKDILRLPYKDSYENLTNKTMLSLEWIANHCMPKFVLKTDDDCFVNILQMLPWLHSLPLSYQYIGKVNDRMPVLRDPQHRNYVSLIDHTEDIYKPYCSGGGYILSGKVLKNITERGKSIKQIINEDAYMGMITNSLGIIPYHEARFLPYIFYEHPERDNIHICDYYSQFLVHGADGQKQLVLHWDNIALKSFPSLCEKI